MLGWIGAPSTPSTADGGDSTVHDWPTLKIAIEQKIQDQTEFVGWWDESIRSVGNPAKKGKDLIVTDQGQLTVNTAEDLTGISKKQVSKWRKRLKDPEKYREALYGATYHKAMAEVNDTTATKWTGAARRKPSPKLWLSVLMIQTRARLPAVIYETINVAREYLTKELKKKLDFEREAPWVRSLFTNKEHYTNPMVLYQSVTSFTVK